MPVAEHLVHVRSLRANPDADRSEHARRPGGLLGQRPRPHVQRDRPRPMLARRAEHFRRERAAAADRRCERRPAVLEPALVPRMIVDIERKAALLRAVGPDVAPHRLLAAFGRRALHRRLPERLVRIRPVGACSVVRGARLAALLFVLHHEGGAPGEGILGRVPHVRPWMTACPPIARQRHRRFRAQRGLRVQRDRRRDGVQVHRC
mmetsp:Transcript_13084/g.41069  ORF Transcript_13084/g.41069 Transcript_13084/m.41069 type:complete len:206 (-) Transcript_13084:97-714(-)